MGRAQLVFGGLRPDVLTPSNSVGRKPVVSPQLALNLSTVARSFCAGRSIFNAKSSIVSALIGGNTDGMNSSSDFASMIA